MLIETSPLAVLTLDQHGKVLVANQSAHALLRRDSQRLAGQDIADYLPLLADFLAMKPTVEVRTSLQCRGQNQDGEAFFAHVWLSMFAADSGFWLAAVIWDATEDLRTGKGPDGRLRWTPPAP